MNGRRGANAAAVLVLAALLTVGSVGCGGSAESYPPESVVPDASRAPDLVDHAVAIAKEIEAEPDATEEILARHGLDVEQFEAMLYEIGSDPELSKAYSAAFE